MSCTACPLHLTARTVCVEGDCHGVVQWMLDRTDILFVGEAPGEVEDVEGKPFVGESGKLLRSTVEEMGLNLRYRVRYTNAVRCRPPSNRPPGIKVSRTCRSHLEKEIKETQPKLIVALGKTAAKSLVGVDRLMDTAGKVLTYEDGTTPVLVIAHPAYILRVRGYITTWRHHLGMIKDLLSTTKQIVDYRLLDSDVVIRGVLRDFVSDKYKPVAFDYETTGLSPWLCQPISVAVCNTPGVVYAFDPEKHYIPWRRFLRTGTPKIVHSASFELSWSLRHWRAWIEGWLWDTQLFSVLEDESRPSGLKFQAVRDTTMTYIEPPVKDWSTLTIDKAWHYNCQDADATLRVYLHQIKRATTADHVRLEKWLRFIRVLVRMRERGVCRIPGLDSLSKDLLNHMGQLKVDMDHLPLVKRWRDRTGVISFSPRSPKQCKDLFFNWYCEKPLEHSRQTGEPRCNTQFL